MKYLSLFSGIEAATVAWKPLGWECVGVAEIDPFASAVLAHHYPDVINLGDITKADYDPTGHFDLIVGGSPCQAFSVAGLRQGFADERGNLTLEFVRLAQRLKPRWLVWENVPGVLSIDGGRAFGSFLGGLAECGYGFAYRVLDAQHFGVPQRRRRVFVVGYLGDWRPPAAVLFEREGLCRDITPSREKREKATPTLNARTKGGGGLGTDFDLDGGLIAETSYTLNADSMKRLDPYSESMIAHSLSAERFDASEDGTGRGTPLVPVQPFTLAIRGREDESRFEYRQDGLANAILTPNGGRAGIGVGAVAFSCKDHGADSGELAPTLRAMGHEGSHANAGGQIAVAIPLQEVGKRTGVSTYDPRAGIGIGTENDPMFTLQAGAQHAVAFAQNARDEVVRMIGGDGSLAGALAAEAGMKQQTYIKTEMAVRRLTPKECERLQGFPDDYTAVPYRGKPAADGPRYKALGNSMAVPCMVWIGKRIQMVVDLQRQLEKAA